MNTNKSDELCQIHRSTDCVCERILASEQVHSVRPLKPTLEDVQADCEALNDEVEQLREVALRAQQREVKAVKRADELWHLANYACFHIELGMCRDECLKRLDYLKAIP